MQWVVERKSQRIKRGNREEMNKLKAELEEGNSSLSTQRKYKWIEFVETKGTKKTKRFRVLSKCDGFELGIIKWYPQWRHYCFFPNIEIQTVYSDRCLKSISAFIELLNKEHKKR